MATIHALPCSNNADIPELLRALADDVESGMYGDAHGISWVCDCGDGVIEVGYLGQSPQPAMNAHYLLAMGMRKLELL